MKTCICAIAKWEELYIREWIDHHKNVGIDHIIVADNNKSNYENPLQPIIQDYIDVGYVTVLNYNDMESVEHSVQLAFYNKMFKQYYNDYDWMFFIDIDEFIELPAYNNDVKLFLSDEKFKDKYAIAFYWKEYTTNSIYYEDQPVKKRINIKAKSNKSNYRNFCISVKTVYSTYLLKNNENFKLESIHLSLKDIDLNNVCDVKGNNKFLINDKQNIVKLENNKNKRLSNIHVEDMNCYNYGYIAHYKIKSCEEYIKYKCIKGRIDVPLKNYHISKLRYSLLDYFRYFAVNHIDIDRYAAIELFKKYDNEISKTIEYKLQYNSE